MQLLCPDIDIPGQNIVGNNILDKGGLIVLFLIAGLGLVHRHGGKNADAPCCAVVAVDKHGVLKLAVQAPEQAVGALRGCENLFRDVPGNVAYLVQVGSDHAQLTARHDKALAVHDADGALRGILELENHTLKNPA